MVELKFTPEQHEIIHRRNVKYRPTFLLNRLIDVFKKQLPDVYWTVSDWNKIGNKSKSYFIQMHYGHHHTNLFCIGHFPSTLIHLLLPEEHSVIQIAENTENLIKKHLI